MHLFIYRKLGQNVGQLHAAVLLPEEVNDFRQSCLEDPESPAVVLIDISIRDQFSAHQKRELEVLGALDDASHDSSDGYRELLDALVAMAFQMGLAQRGE